MRGGSAGCMLRDGAANQLAAVQWPQLMNPSKELAEIVSGSAANTTCFSMFEGLYLLEYFVILDHVTVISYDRFPHTHLKWTVDHCYRTSEWPPTDPGMELVVNLLWKHWSTAKVYSQFQLMRKHLQKWFIDVFCIDMQSVYHIFYFCLSSTFSPIVDWWWCCWRWLLFVICTHKFTFSQFVCFKQETGGK